MYNTLCLVHTDIIRQLDLLFFSNLSFLLCWVDGVRLLFYLALEMIEFLCSVNVLGLTSDRPYYNTCF